MSSRVSRVQREKKKRRPHPKHPGGVDAVSFFLRSLINGLLGQAAAAVLVGAAGVVEFLLFHFSPPPPLPEMSGSLASLIGYTTPQQGT